jgi:probable F420-dependent oxidoreductase
VTRFGIIPPIVTTGQRPAWESEAGVGELVTVAQAADRLGYAYFTCSDHVAVPPGLFRGERFYDPLATFSYLAALTQRIRFVPYVLVLPFHHPLELAKRYGTLDLLSGGRLTLGLGVGNLRDEFDMLGVPFDDRGARSDDALRALRAALSKRVVSYSGEFFRFDNLVVDPHAVQEHLPIWIGGHTVRSLRRAVTLADAWCPSPVPTNGPRPPEMRAMLDRFELPEHFEVVATPERLLDPAGEPDVVVEAVEELVANGATSINVMFRQRSLAQYLEQLQAMAQLFGLPASA